MLRFVCFDVAFRRSLFRKLIERPFDRPDTMRIRPADLVVEKENGENFLASTEICQGGERRGGRVILR